MSVFTAKTGLSSILKAYSPAEREKAKNAIINKVRFEMPKEKGLLQAFNAVCEGNNRQPLNEFVDFLREAQLTDVEFLAIFNDARLVANDLDVNYTNLVETLLALSWCNRTPEAVQVYMEFCIDIMLAHSKYIHFGINKLITLWIPVDMDTCKWPNGTPDEETHKQLTNIHKLLDRILSTIPMTFDVVLETIETKFPYYKKPTHVVAGYVHNVLWLIDYKPMFTEFAIQLILQKMIILDVNAPRNQIEEEEDDSDNDDDDDEDMDEDGDENEEIFQMDDNYKDDKKDNETIQSMKHPIAQTLDICMEKLFMLLSAKNPNAQNLKGDEKLERNTQAMQFFKILLAAFDNVILPCHNTHHVQFLILYYCSFKTIFAETFLTSLWDKIKNPNVSPVIRQAAVGYVASFLARAKYVPLDLLKYYLKELCEWSHQYIERSDQYRTNGSLKANLVFFATCQAIFYMIAFRSRALTTDKKDIHFLQSLQLSALVTCNFNPLRVCLPAVATAFAGVTRAYQLAYCHSILERNARRKLATVYTTYDTATPEETLDTFFPFDPYLLKTSGHRIANIYLQYQASEAEEHQLHAVKAKTRKRNDSEMAGDDVDDFLIADKRQKFLDMSARSHELEAQFTYGMSPGFHM